MKLNMLNEQNLQWIQPSTLRMAYELRANRQPEPVATLTFQSPFLGFLATATSLDGCWTFNTAGPRQPEIVIRQQGSSENVAVFKNSERGEKGILELPNGTRLAARGDFRKNQYEIQTEAGDCLVRLQASGWLHLSGRVAVLPPAPAIEEWPWLVMLGWYLTVIFVSPGEFGFRRVIGYLGFSK